MPDTSSKSFFKKIAILYGVVVLILASFSIGILVGKNIESPKLKEKEQQAGKVLGKDEPLPEFLGKDVKFNLYFQVWQKIQEEFIDRPVPEPKLFYGSLAGMVASLSDPYSVFLEPKVAQDFQEELKGKFEGIGAEIGIKKEELTIIAPLPKSPAEKAGIKAGDKVLAIDDFNTRGISLDEAVRRIRGPKGTEVTLTVKHMDKEESKEITITRDTIKIISVRWEMKEVEDTKGKIQKIAYIKISNFNEDTTSRFKKAVNEILTQGPDGIILDLRNNPGGFLDRAVEIAGYWVQKDEIVVQEKFSSLDTKNYLSPYKPTLNRFKTIVLVNPGSASGSEIVAGALQDYNLATLVGEKTFGKGSVQNLEELEGGSAVKLTIARWLTPNGREIDQEGIKPDIEVELTEEDYNEDRDPQLEKALELFTR